MGRAFHYVYTRYSLLCVRFELSKYNNAIPHENVFPLSTRSCKSFFQRPPCLHSQTPFYGYSSYIIGRDIGNSWIRYRYTRIYYIGVITVQLQMPFAMKGDAYAAFILRLPASFYILKGIRIRIITLYLYYCTRIIFLKRVSLLCSCPTC